MPDEKAMTGVGDPIHAYAIASLKNTTNGSSLQLLKVTNWRP
jgi:hypothetical protein